MITVLKEMVEHHVEEEEKEMFKEMRQAFTKQELKEMAQGFDAAKEGAFENIDDLAAA
jgi:thioredoxin-like negative regulator of GroEL